MFCRRLSWFGVFIMGLDLVFILFCVFIVLSFYQVVFSLFVPRLCASPFLPVSSCVGGC